MARPQERSARTLLMNSRYQTNLEDVAVNEIRDHFFAYQSENSKGSKRFMQRFWSIACRWKTIMDSKADNGPYGVGSDENKAQLLDDFMMQVERWQGKFKQIACGPDGYQLQDKWITSVVEGWKVEAKVKFEEADVNSMLEMEKDKNKASKLDHWVKEMYLRRIHAYWSMLDDEQVYSVINFLGGESVRFMECLSVAITAQHLEVYEDLFDRVVNRRYQFKGRQLGVAEATFDAVSTETDEDDDDLELKVWNAIAPDDPLSQQTLSDRLFYPVPQKVEIQFYWCGVKNLLAHSKIELIAALSVCDEQSGIFTPVVSRALFKHHWDYCHNLFVFDRLMDVVSLTSLCVIVYWSKFQNCSIPVDPTQMYCFNAAEQASKDKRTSVLIWTVAIINLFMLFQVVSEAVTAFSRGVRAYATTYNLFLVFMELYTLRILWSLLGILPAVTDHETGNTTAAPAATEVAASIFTQTMRTKPMFFLSLIVFKWGQFLLGFLVFDIGKIVLPAVYAMKSGESVKFVIYMGLAILACTHAYWSLPLQPDDYEVSGKFGSAYTSFFRMFRLCVMGDFDIWELEGVDGAVDQDGYVDEPPSDWTNTTAQGGDLGKAYYFHEDIRVIIMSFGMVLTMMLMNMYIGVLSLAYEKFLGCKLEVFSHAKSKFMLRYLLRRNAWRKVAKKLMPDHDFEEDTLPRIVQIEEERPHAPITDLIDNFGDWDEDNPPVHPDGWKEHILVDKIHWVGFWVTIPQDLMATEEAEEMYQDMEDNQVHMTDKLESIEATVKGIDEMVDTLMGSR